MSSVYPFKLEFHFTVAIQWRGSRHSIGIWSMLYYYIYSTDAATISDKDTSSAASTGIPWYLTRVRAHNAAAMVIYGLPRSAHISIQRVIRVPTFIGFRVAERIKFKL